MSHHSCEKQTKEALLLPIRDSVDTYMSHVNEEQSLDKHQEEDRHGPT